MQYELTQDPKLRPQLQAPLTHLLESALQSHQVALEIQNDDTDALFNTAQVMTSLAEAVLERRSPTAEDSSAPQLLREALKLFRRCLELQVSRYAEQQEGAQEGVPLPLTESNEAQSNATSAPGNAPPETAASSPSTRSEGEEWVSIVEPVTKDTLIDTSIAQLQTLTALCGQIVSDPLKDLEWIEKYAFDLLSGQLDDLTTGTTRQQEVTLARSNFICAIADISFRVGKLDLSSYMRELESAFGDHPELNDNPEWLCDKADALVALNASITDAAGKGAPLDQAALEQYAKLRWRCLSQALDSLNMASKLPTADNRARINIARGDVELLRLRLGELPWNYGQAIEHSSTLLKNAATYYRGAETLARNEELEMEAKQAVFRRACALFSMEGKGSWEDLGFSRQEAKGLAEDMLNEGLVHIDLVERFLPFLENE